MRQILSQLRQEDAVVRASPTGSGSSVLEGVGEVVLGEGHGVVVEGEGGVMEVRGSGKEEC